MKYLNALNTIQGLGAKKLKLLVNHFETAEEIWHASLDELTNSGISEDVARIIIEKRPSIDPEQEWLKLEKENIQVFTEKDPQYPALLKQIPDNPHLIYTRGDLACLKLPLIAVVGSRKLTSYGIQAAHGFAKSLAKNGICVVSGLAFGIDACAHRGALEAGGKTIAVLGNSLDDQNLAPRSNFNLAQDILAGGGLLISEFSVPTKAEIWTFPARNRIMAGMSLGTLVIEAAEKSGSLITANLTLDYNREVFAVPGSIFSPQSTGTHKLIKAGAKLVSSAMDVIGELRLDYIENKPSPRAATGLSQTEEKIYQELSHESLHIDIITKLTKLETSAISSTLALLEIKGLIRNVGGQNYIRL
ncbi:MAG: hypothetical protein ACD_56C00060G0015 [uncultured bacterium]|nr:MAG: hypothetical protein ACD_56C00060G0015 [uncultured bacterium]